MPTDVAVREFEAQDGPACRRLWVDLTTWHRELYEDPSIGGDEPAEGFDQFLDEYREGRLWVAETGTEVVGFAGLVVRGVKAELEPVVVAPESRGRGIGRSLVEAALEAARSAGVQQVVVRPVSRNANALAFFHQLGFTALGHVELLLDFQRPDDYWRAGERLGGRDFRV